MRHHRQAPPARRPSRRGILLAALPLVALTLLAYAGIQRHAFTHYDDWIYITENPHVRGGLSAANVAWAFTTGHAANWHPLTWISHQLDVTCFGLWAGGHHLTSLALHVLSALLLLLVLRALTGSPWRSALVAALFALHPTRVESVAWAAERKDLLCGLFWILAMGTYGRYARAKPGPHIRWYLLTLLLFSLSLMSKPMAVTFPFVLLLLDWWPLGRWRVSIPLLEGRALTRPTRRSSRQEEQQPSSLTPETRPLALLLLEKLPFFLLAAASAAITLQVQATGGAIASTQFISFAGRLANGLVAYALYLKMLILPVNLAVFYPLPIAGYPVWQPLAALTLLVIITWLAWRNTRHHPALLMGWLWFLGTLVPVIGFVKVGMQALADRYTYLPFIGLFIMAAWGITWNKPHTENTQARTPATALSRVSRFQNPGSSILLLLILVCAFLTHRQLSCWRNSLTLVDHALRVTRDNDVAHVIAGNYWAQRGDTEAAIAHYRDAVRISPDAALYLFNLGALYDQAGQAPAAESHYRRAITLDPNYEKAHLNLGRLYHQQGNVDLAVRHYREVLRLNPANAIAHFNLSVALASTGDEDAAIASVERALQLDPTYEKARAQWERLQLRTAQPLQ